MAPGDEGCLDIKDFLQELDIYLDVRDISEKPLSYKEIEKLIRHLNIEHFINSSSPTYSKKNLDKGLPERNEMFQIFADNNDLLRIPIVVAGRLMVIGPNRHKIIEMLQLKSDESGEEDKV
jgi:arsenate reductase-like glutaredoxin family protein